MESSLKILNKCVEEYQRIRHWNRSDCDVAASVGDLNALKLAHQSGARLSSFTAEEAALFGHLECLKYVLQHVDLTKYVYESALEGKDPKCIEFLETHYPHFKEI
jgi:hypothetical protein